MRKKERVMGKIIVNGYAKINLHLDVTGFLPNGFHAVANVMQSVSLCDVITLTPKESGECTVSCDVEGVPLGEDNIVMRARAAFCRACGEDIAVDINIQKRIPMAAGLAGGSADAAAVLRGLNAICSRPLGIEELCAIGGELGADIPFCIVGGSAYADGKGDILHPFPAMPDCILVVACGGEGVSTPAAYRRLDDIYNNFSDYSPRSLAPLRAALESRDIAAVAASIFNIFEAPTLEHHAVARQLRSAMLSSGALGAMMSGSGPSVFGIFENYASAEAACEKIRKIGVTPHICKPIERAE